MSIRPADYRRRFEEDVEATVAELRRPALRLPRADIDRLHGAQTAFLEEHGGLLESRAERGRIVEGHGDLRPEHVCLLEEPVVIDCLEFDAALRVLDPLDELAYLALECERLGAGWIGRQLLAGFDEANGEVSDAGLVGFYQGFRALVRAKLAAWHTEDDSVNDHDGWRSRACEYLALAVERRGPGPGRVR